MERRTFVRNSVLSTAGVFAGKVWGKTNPGDLKILNPRNRVPVSFIIDDSTALVNLAYYGIPQFKEVFPDQYLQDWKKLPQEIPDSFVLEFLEWCDINGVKGKYSMVPYPACTGWLHRFIPGWTKKELEQSIKIVRELAQPSWDIHSEMISHTRVINTKTGMPFPEASPDFMENWEWSQTKSADELGEYIGYALQVLKDAGLHCDGVTTPGGFGSRNIPNLARGTQMAVRDVFGGRVAHFFRDVVTDINQSVQPQVFHAEGLESEEASCSVHIIGCTGDWFGGWDGLNPGDPDRFITPDLNEGRMVEVIESGEPAIMVCHWPGIYYNGDKVGFNIFKTVVSRLHEKYDHLIWLKLSEISSYWAAKEFTRITNSGNQLEIWAPFECTDFTIQIPGPWKNPVFKHGEKTVLLSRVNSSGQLAMNTWCPEQEETILTFDLPRGKSTITFD